VLKRSLRTVLPGGLLAATVVATGLVATAPAQAIGGGTPAADGAYTFVAKLDIGGVRSCTGALISPEWVLTSNSCFPENGQLGGTPKAATTVTVGRTDLTKPGGRVVAVTDLIPRTDRDVVLARLASPVTDVTPLALGTTPAAVDDVLRIAGFGRTSTEWVPDRLHTATVSVRSSTATTLAVSGREPATATTCKGDSGGPAFRETGGAPQLVALHLGSWQNGCFGETETRQGTSETRVDDLSGWIAPYLRGDTYTALASQQRVLDTRTGPARIGPGQTITVPMPGIPRSASAVVVNLVAIGGTQGTFLTAFGDKYTGTSNVNNEVGHISAAMATVALGADGALRIRNNAGDVDALVDLLGYFSATGGSTYVPAAKPQLVLDTRTPLGGHNAVVKPEETVTLAVRGAGGVPADATAVALNITAAGNAFGGFLAVYPKTRTETTTLNLTAKEDRANQAIVGIGDDGAVRIANRGSELHVLATVLGWYVPGEQGSRFVALDNQARVADTRSGLGVPAKVIGPGGTISVRVGGLGSVPAQATAASVGITAVAPTGNTFLTAWPHGGTFPSSESTLNVQAGAVTANSATVGLGDGQFDLRNRSWNVDVVVDVQGYYVR
jgi:hypothetical protein